MKAILVDCLSLLRLAVLALAMVLQTIGAGAYAESAQVDALRAKHDELRQQLEKSTFKEPLVLSSADNGDQVSGDVYAELNRPFADIAAAFRSAAKVCELLSLHLNVRGCRAVASRTGEVLQLSVGPKRAAAPGMVYSMSYAMRVEADAPQYLRVLLSAKEGPLSTSDYRIVFEAAPMDPQETFVHFSYAYGYGILAKAAMTVYLATAGSSKIGFTVVSRTADGRPVYVTGERGALERNVMRYYLALIAYVSPLPGPQSKQAEDRQRIWFDLTERYAAQLHEFELDEYLDEKRKDSRARTAGRD